MFKGDQLDRLMSFLLPSTKAHNTHLLQIFLMLSEDLSKYNKLEICVTLWNNILHDTCLCEIVNKQYFYVQCISCH